MRRKNAQSQHSDQIGALRERFDVFLETYGSRLGSLNDKTQISVVDAQEDTVAVGKQRVLEGGESELTPTSRVHGVT